MKFQALLYIIHLTVYIYSQSIDKAEVAELADALGSGPNVRKDVGVRIPASAL